MSSEQNCRIGITNILSRADIYSSNVNLYFKGQKRITSKIGLVATWIVVVLMLAYATYRGRVLLMQTDFKTQMSNTLNPMNFSHTDITQMNEYGFDFAFTMGAIPVPKEIGETRFELVRKTFDSSDFFGTLKEIRTTIELEPCTLENFNNTNKDELETKGIKICQCIKNKTLLALGGAELSNLFQFIELQVFRCVNESDSNITCRPKEEIDYFFQTQKLYLLISNNYFDKDDAENPIKNYIEESFYFAFIPGITSYVRLYVQLAEARFFESILPWATATLRKFSLIERSFQMSQLQKSDSEPMIQLRLYYDQWKNNYLKEIFSLTEFFSEVGGMFNSIYGCGKFLVFLFADSIFLSKLLGSLYSYQKHSKLLLSDTDMTISQRIQQELLTRQPFRISASEFLKSYCCFKNKREDSDAPDRKIYLYKQGKRKIIQELDVANLLKLAREFKQVKQLLFTRAQLLLLGASRRSVLEVGRDDEALDASFSQILHVNDYRSSSNPLQSNIVKFKSKEMLEAAIKEAEKSELGQKILFGIVGEKSKCLERHFTNRDGNKGNPKSTIPNQLVKPSKMRKKSSKAKSKKVLELSDEVRNSREADQMVGLRQNETTKMVELKRKNRKDPNK